MQPILSWLTAGTPPHYAMILAVAALLVWEMWLGKTQKVKANSTLELLGNAVATVVRTFFPAAAAEASAVEKSITDRQVISIPPKDVK